MRKSHLHNFKKTEKYSPAPSTSLSQCHYALLEFLYKSIAMRLYFRNALMIGSDFEVMIDNHFVYDL